MNYYMTTMYLLLKDLVGMAKTAIMEDTFLLGLEADIAELTWVNISSG